ncbi:MAG: PLP-dependent aminotransferase family protein [Solirubrobacteraceae bacterium]
MRTSKEPLFSGAGPELLLALHRGSGATMHEQLESLLRDHVRSGRLAAGTRLPSSRALAGELGVSRGVVLEAYSQLSAEGYLTASQGAPTRVALNASAERPPVPASSLGPRYAYSFDPGVPDLAGFPRDRWLRSLRASLSATPFDGLARGDPRGTPELRNELMVYLARARGTAPEPEHTLVCSGFTQGFAVLCRTLRDRGLERIAVENPGWVEHRLIAERAGLEPVAIGVDGDGIDVSALRESGCEAVVVTPAHQFPTGVVLASERRAELLEWAEDTDGLIIEDDYDSELRYDRDAVGALQGLAPERVAHLGSVSKRLVPGLRIGWMLSPSWLTGALTYEKALGDGGSSVLDQRALADFIARGELDRHIRRTRLRYRERRAALMRELAMVLPEVRFSGIAAGLYVLALLPTETDEVAVEHAAAGRGVLVEGLGPHHGCTSPGRPGLILGYANLSPTAIEQAVALLSEAVREASPAL